MSLASNLSDLATRVATECKGLRILLNGNAADLAALTTTAKGNLVLAVNELKGAIDALEAASGAPIDDGATAPDTTWSSNKISAEIVGLINGVLNGAPAALDTLEELAAAIGDDQNFAATVTAALGNRVRVDTAAQGLTDPQKANARTNIGAAAAADVGDTATNFVTVFEAGLT
ncbi:hypothetical protein [Sphingosinicella sp. CPCC 101087]|uniref:hypothetical protein n=1 Tax=Sphingosinicella sp. CPCC 101087 TaxID=2497754 RepID=UPI00101BF83C|nr:hypothetical protein [Sphingosinicella sp. CPCC 101087]